MGLFQAVAMVFIVFGTVIQTIHTQQRYGKFLDTSDHVFRPNSLSSDSFRNSQRELINAPIVLRKPRKRSTRENTSPRYSSHGGGYYGGGSSSRPSSGYGYGSGSNDYVTPEYVPGAAGGGLGYYPPSGGGSGSGRSYGGDGYGGSSGYGSKGYAGSSDQGGYGGNQGYGYGDNSGGYDHGSQGQGYSHGGGDHSGGPGYSEGYPEEKAYSGGGMGKPKANQKQNEDDIEVSVKYGDGSPAQVIEDEGYGTSYMDGYKDVQDDFSRHNYDQYQPPSEVGEYPQGGSNSIGQQSVYTAAERFTDTVKPYMYYGGQDKLTHKSSTYNGPQNLIMSGKAHRPLSRRGAYQNNWEMDLNAMSEQSQPRPERKHVQYELDNFHQAPKQSHYYNQPRETTYKQLYPHETFEPYRNNIDQKYGDDAHSLSDYKKGHYHANAHLSERDRKSHYQMPHWQEQSGTHSNLEERPYTNSYVPRVESQDSNSHYHAEDNHDASPPFYYTKDTIKDMSQGPSVKRDLYDHSSQGTYYRKQPYSRLPEKGNGYPGYATESKKSQGEINNRYGIQYGAHERSRNNGYNQYSNNHDRSGSLYTTLKAPSYEAFNDYSHEEFSSNDHQAPSKTTDSYSNPRPISPDHVYAPMKEDLGLLSSIYYIGSPNNPNKRGGQFTRDQFHSGEQRRVDEHHPVKHSQHPEPLSMMSKTNKRFAKKAKEMMLGRVLRTRPQARPQRESLRDAFRSGYGLRVFPNDY